MFCELFPLETIRWRNPPEEPKSLYWTSLTEASSTNPNGRIPSTDSRLIRSGKTIYKLLNSLEIKLMKLMKIDEQKLMKVKLF